MRKKFPPSFQSNLRSIEESQKLLFFSYRELLYEFFYLILGNKELALSYFHALYLRFYKAKKTFLEHATKKEGIPLVYLFRLALDELEERERTAFSLQSPFFPGLSFAETIVLIFRDRFFIAKEEMLSILGCTPGSLDLQLLHARDKLALSLRFQTSISLAGKIRSQQALDLEVSKAIDLDDCSLSYYRALKQVRKHISCIEIAPAEEKEFQKLFESNRKKKKDSLRSSFPRQYHFLLQNLSLAILGSLMVVFVPRLFSNSQDITKQREDKISFLSSARAREEIASLSSLNKQQVDVLPEKFPSSRSYSRATAHKAPSLQKQTIYRLIVESENPKEMIPYIKTIFQKAQVKEKLGSGSRMPGGVFFDGTIEAKNYAQIYFALSNLAPTNAYLNKKKIKNAEKARIIVWIQQI